MHRAAELHAEMTDDFPSILSTDKEVCAVHFQFYSSRSVKDVWYCVPKYPSFCTIAYEISIFILRLDVTQRLSDPIVAVRHAMVVENKDAGKLIGCHCNWLIKLVVLPARVAHMRSPRIQKSIKHYVGRISRTM
jgi:hypothetical protein